LTILDRLLEREPNDLAILTKKGRVELELSRYEAAVGTLGKVAARTPLDEKVRLSLAIARLGAGQLDQAQSDYQELLKTTKKPKNALFGLGSIAWRKQETNQAIELYQQYLSTGIPG